MDWLKDGETFIRKLRGGKIIAFGNKRAFVKGEASLLLTNVELSDNGTYTVAVEAPDVQDKKSRDLVVIVQSKLFSASSIKLLIVVHTVYLLYGWRHIREAHREKRWYICVLNEFYGTLALF